MKKDFSPYFPEKSSSYTVNGVRFRTHTLDFEAQSDLYKTISEAEERALNIGCSGYRKTITDATGNVLYSPCSSSLQYTSIMNDIRPIQMQRRYYQFDQRDNLSDVRDSINDEVLEGFDYKDQIFKRTLSNVIFRNPDKEETLSYLQKVIFALIESVKQIRNSFNYTVPFNNRRVF